MQPVGAVSSKWAKGTGGPAGDECQNLVAALTTRGYDDNDGQESRLVAHTLRGDGFDASEDGTGKGTPLVTAFHGSQDPDVSGSVTHPVGRNQGQETCVMASGVRRLTPRECERLQGLPDDHTLVPYRGKPAADGPRYKAIGNGMAVPVVAWILRRIDRAFTSAGLRKCDPEISRGFSLPATSI